MSPLTGNSIMRLLHGTSNRSASSDRYQPVDSITVMPQPIGRNRKRNR